MTKFERTWRVANALARIKSFFAVPTQGGSWWWPVRESFTGAWQQNVTVESRENLLTFSQVFACISLIADDISKMRVMLMRQEASGIWKEITGASPFWPVLRKPNRFQTMIQFLSLWIITKLLHGNVYILKERDQRGVVVALYILDSRRVIPLITETGDVYYQLQGDYLAGLQNPITIPAREIIHDRMLCLWHPLVGISPLVACGTSATQGLRIQSNSEVFFKNMSRPSGHLTAPGTIPDETAARLKKQFEENFSGTNIGRLLVTGDALKYEPLTIPAQAAQLIEQLQWTGKDVAACFKVPLYKLGLADPPGSSLPVLNQDYYSQTLQIYIESIELLFDEGLGLTGGPQAYRTELDLSALLRMDPLSRADINAKEIGSGMRKPNEARADEGLDPVEGGDACYLQQQNYSLAALAKRDAMDDPFGKAPASAAPALPAPQEEPAAEDAAAKASDEAFADALIAKLKASEFELENA